MSKKILVLLGHPNNNSLSGTLADYYQTGAEDAEHEVQRINLGDLQFDPVLRDNNPLSQPLEADLLRVQESILWADHVAIFYPNWWCAMPALLKGFFDRIWHDGFAFTKDEEGKIVEKHLKGKTARIVIVSGDNGPFTTWWKYGDYTNEIQHSILGTAGFTTSLSAFGPTNTVSETQKGKWLQRMEKLGHAGR